MRRFECVFVEDEEFGGIIRRLKDNETGIVHMTCDVADLLNFQNTQIKMLKEEIEELKNHDLQHFLEWLVIKGYVTDEPMKDINNVIDCVKKFKEYLTDEQFE